MDLNRLYIFAKIAEHQSFTRAAQELGMDKSTVSNKLAQLESHLGVRLMNRSTRSVSLTEAGEGYYRYCQQIIGTAKEAEQFTASVGKDAVGLLRVAGSNDFGGVFIRKLIRPFMQENPKIAMELILDYQNADLVKDRIDVALRANIGAESLQDSSLIAKKILDDELGLFCSPEFIQQYGEFKTPDQAGDFDFIQFSIAGSSGVKARKGKKVQTFKTQGRFKANDILACKEAALSGLGIALLPRFLVIDELADQQLIPLLADYQLPSFTVYAVYPSRHWVPAKLKVFLAYLERLDEYCL